MQSILKTKKSMTVQEQKMVDDLVRTNHELATKIQEQATQLQELLAQIAYLRRQLFGRKSEKLRVIDPNQLSLFDEPIAQEVVAAQQEATEKIEKETPAERKQQRKNRKMMEGLPVLERIVLKVEGIDDTYKKIGTEITRMVKIIPAKLGVVEYLRYKYIKVNEDGLTVDVRIAPMPRFPINKCIADATLLAETILNKYEYHLPLYRQVQQYRHLGFRVTESTLAGWIKPTAELLRPLYETLVDEVFRSHYIQCDETTVPVVDKTAHKARKEYLWLARAVKERLRCFYYDDGSRAGAVIATLTKQHHYKGYLQCDGFGGYETAFRNNGNVQLVNCMAHIRRHFEQALQENRQAAEYVLGEIQKLYRVESRCASLTDDERQHQRDELSRPIMVHLKAWMETEGLKYSEGSLIGKAITYAYSRWDNMMRYLDEGYLLIDNNLAENAIRPIALGRKNYLFCGNHEAAGWMTIICSLIGTCKEQNINPRLYLNDVIDRMPYVCANPLKKPSRHQLLQLLPHKWILSHPEARIDAPASETHEELTTCAKQNTCTTITKKPITADAQE